MTNAGCIFCKIANGEIPAYKIYEDRKYLAFLDIFPNVDGQTLLIPKKHMASLFSEIGDDELAAFMIAAKKVANRIRRKLEVARVHAVLEGTGVNHLHAKLYPTSKLKGGEFREIIAAERVFFKRYPGFVTTLMGPRANDLTLKRIQQKILG